MAERFISLRDRFDGGGKGKAGDTFEGGVFSDFLNRAGVRPVGYAERQAMLTAPTSRPSLREAASGGVSLPPRMMMTPNSMSDRAAIAAAPRPAPQPAPMTLPPRMMMTDTSMSDRAAIAAAPRPAQQPAPMTAPPAVISRNGVMIHNGNAGSPNQGGRGTVGMPIPHFLQNPESIRAIEELRRLGMISM